MIQDKLSLNALEELHPSSELLSKAKDGEVNDKEIEMYLQLDKDLRQNHHAPENGFDDEENDNDDYEPEMPTEQEFMESNRILVEGFNSISYTTSEEATSLDLASSSSHYSTDKRALSFHTQQINNQSKEYEAERILDRYLQQVRYLSLSYWEAVVKDQESKTVGGNVNIKAVYKTEVISILIATAKECNWFVGKKGDKLFLYNHETWIPCDEDLLKEAFKNISVKLGVSEWLAMDNKFTNDIYEHLLASSFFHKMEQPDSTLINLQNGTLRIGLNGVELLDFNPYHFLTHQLDFPYDLSAINYPFRTFVNDVLPDIDTQKTLQQSLGYLFTQGLKIEKCIFFYGTGSNGKSVIFDTMNNLLGPDLITNYSLESLVDSKGYHRAELNDKLINYGSDITMDKINKGVFKQLVSGEAIDVRQIYQKPFIMKKYAKLIFNLNKIDNADTESTIGFFRRMIFIPFEKTITEDKQDKTLSYQISQNKSGILNWILEGTREVLTNKEIFVSQKCTDFLDNFKKESNLSIRFAEEYALTPSNTETISFQVMYDKFVKFCKDEGEKKTDITKTIFNKELKKLNFTSRRATGGMVWQVLIPKTTH